MPTLVISVFGAAIAGAVAFATPASADITVTPTQATQADAARLALRVTSDSRTASVTKVQLSLPAATPIAEVYPLSNPDWAPGLTNRKLDQPIEQVHGTQTTNVVAAITWFAVAGHELKPGRAAVLDMELGPLPQTDQITLAATLTHSDGSVTHPNLTLKLVPATGGTAHGGTAADDSTANPQASEDSTGSGGTKVALIISLLVIGVFAGTVVAGFAMRRRIPALTLPSSALDTEPSSATAEPSPEHATTSS